MEGKLVKEQGERIATTMIPSRPQIDMDAQRRERIRKFLAEHQRQNTLMFDVDFLLLFEKFLDECEQERVRQ